MWLCCVINHAIRPIVDFLKFSYGGLKAAKSGLRVGLRILGGEVDASGFNRQNKTTRRSDYLELSLI
jgi:hypothetical protein